MLLDSYQNHPEAKSLGPDGAPCEFDAQGLLQRAHIVANWPPIYIGKESDKHWEEGDDLSLLDFKAVEYKRKGNSVASVEQLARIAKVPKREFMRRGINQHTLEKISNREPVRPKASRQAAASHLGGIRRHSTSQITHPKNDRLQSTYSFG
jgi:hypothetical protein